MAAPAVTTYDPADILEMLQGQPFLHGYHLMLFRAVTPGDGDELCWELCQMTQSPLSGKLPFVVFHEAIEVAIIGKRTATLRSPEGLYVFAVPFILRDQGRYCLVGTGARDKTLDLAGVESLAKITGSNPVVLLELLQKLPVLAKHLVHNVAEKTARAIEAHTEEQEKVVSCDEVFDKLAAVVRLCTEIDRMPTGGATMSLFLETMLIVFDVPHLGIALTGNAPQQLGLSGTWEPPTVTKKIVPHRIHNLFPQVSTGKSFVIGGGEIAAVFPEPPVCAATCLLFWAKDDDCGMLTLLDAKLADGDIPLVELICSRVANRLQQLHQEEQLLKASSQSQKMLHLISSILMIENREELYDTLLESASGLVGARNGSFMVMDANGEDLCIEATKGLNAHLAKSFIVKVGEGIAGKVAAGATALLIRDIETDCRVSRTNRSRFKTKSFVSLPISHNQRVIGVLNLSDKDNGSTFDEKDLETLTSFAGHLAGVVYRCRSQATAAASTSATLSDPLTGLYTQPFLMRRVQEEISRCKRQGRILALMRVQLTEAGAAGDRAIKAVADMLDEMMRDMDVISRCGATSLCLMLPETGKREAVLVGERIRAHLVKTLALTMEPQIKAAVSVAVYPEDGKTCDQLMAAAERALFHGNATTISGFMPLPERLGEGPASRGLFGTSITLRDSRQLLPLFHDRPDRDNPPDVQQVLAASIDLPAE